MSEVPSYQATRGFEPEMGPGYDPNAKVEGQMAEPKIISKKWRILVKSSD